MNYDLIGDIHGHADELEALLIKLGYAKVNDIYQYKTPTRQVIFVGDLIDRGPKVRETLQIVKGMVDRGSALCIMGNHEYNAIGFWHQPPFRSVQSIKNLNQQAATMKSFQNRQEEWLEYVEWFKTLPIMLELPKLRVVHAYWSHEIYTLTLPPKEKPDQPVYLDRNFKILPSHYLFQTKQAKTMIEKILKGKKVSIPNSYQDKDGNLRTETRINWWVNTTDSKTTCGEYYEKYIIDKLPELASLPVPQDQMTQFGYPLDQKPIFFGHYALKNTTPYLQAPNVCCLDYGMGKGGELVAYRWSGEQELKMDNFVTL